MFSITKVDFSNGAYDGYNPYSKLNGMEVMILESHKKADDVIKDFESVLQAGMDPNQVIDKVLQDRHYSEHDFTDMDINRINRKVEAIYKSVNNKNERAF